MIRNAAASIVRRRMSPGSVVDSHFVFRVFISAPCDFLRHPEAGLLTHLRVPSPDPSGWSTSDFPALESHNALVPNRDQYLPGHLEVRKRYVLDQGLNG